MPTAGDTIAAIATPSGDGGVGVIRLSGPAAAAIARGISGKSQFKPRYAHFCRFYDAEGLVLDSGLLLFFPAPRSFTGEDVAELQAHGGRVALELLLRRVLELGARLAEPGEFSLRAFLNKKLDLAQAEAIADLISSGTEEAARSAQRSLQGEFSNLINELVDELIELRVYVEAAIDFVDQEIDFLHDGAVSGKIASLLRRIEQISASARQGRLLHDGMTVVLAGAPNAGKSSLLNALAGHEAAIVADAAGTTRDVLRERIQLDGMPLHIIDTAGLRASGDAVEQEGVRRARREITKADQVLWLIDCRGEADDAVAEELPLGSKPIKVFNKIDLTGLEPALKEAADGTEIYLSVKTGAGLPLLKQHLKQCAGFSETNAGVFTARTRHLHALRQAAEALQNAASQLDSLAPELTAEELLAAQRSLAAITGEFSADDLLGEIFGSFCIGK